MFLFSFSHFHKLVFFSRICSHFAYIFVCPSQFHSIIYNILYGLLIIGFAYFYSSISFNAVDISKNLQQNGGFVPGIRPGKPTSEFIQKVLNKITLFGALYLAIIAIVPILISHFSTRSSLTNLSIGGTSIIIVVGVALETVRAIEAQMLMRNYKGFLS